MTQVHRSSCPVLGTLVLAGFAFAALAAPAQAAAPAVLAPHTASAQAAAPAPLDHLPAPGHGTHDFGWQ
ncbi:MULTISPECIES: hypothetical protein [unclassified Streptomyces]|uniref:hypothetical protein n=1 Tax=unclassified Streptomyces TaxID=2593676 RepID=UPI00048BA9CF|nr:MULTISPECIES: hypothetical protein [unclassified Streptomyces]MYY19639.1 hypothetical protein [Streptomyces sp. SID4912]SCD70153.1 hypothetical protein GA0115241_105640 [Streptomyces sp. DpondAA-D4]